MIEFDLSLSCGVKRLAVKKKNETIKPTTRFFSGKILMFAKLSLKVSFTNSSRYNFFPNQKTREIYGKYMTESIIPYSVLTDTDNFCIFFIFICKPSCNIQNEKFYNVLFEVITNNEGLNRFDTSQEFWDRFNVRNANLRKKLGYFSIENIDDPYLVIVAVKPKEYFEQFESDNVKKKHKGLRKSASGMEFENY